MQPTERVKIQAAINADKANFIFFNIISSVTFILESKSSPIKSNIAKFERIINRRLFPSFPKSGETEKKVPFFGIVDNNFLANAGALWYNE